MGLQEGDILINEEDEYWVIIVHMDNNGVEAVQREGSYVEYFSADSPDSLLDLDKFINVSNTEEFVDGSLLDILQSNTRKVGIPKLAKDSGCHPDEIRNLRVNILND